VQSSSFQLLQDRQDNTVAKLAAVQNAFQAKFDIVNDSFNEKLSLAVDCVVQSNAAQIKDVSGKLIGGFSDLVKKVDTDGRSRIDILRKQVQALSNNAKGAAVDCTYLSAPSSGDNGADSAPDCCVNSLPPDPDETPHRGLDNNDDHSSAEVPAQLDACTSCTAAAFSVGDCVRLHGLRAGSLNGKVGTVTEFIESSGRYGILLHGEQSSKALLSKNMTAYMYVEGDTCTRCHEYLNFNAFPPCSCSIADLRTSTSGTDRVIWSD
jgi:hypothetical protein